MPCRGLAVAVLMLSEGPVTAPASGGWVRVGLVPYVLGSACVVARVVEFASRHHSPPNANVTSGDFSHDW